MCYLPAKKGGASNALVIATVLMSFISLAGTPGMQSLKRAVDLLLNKDLAFFWNRARFVIKKLKVAAPNLFDLNPKRKPGASSVYQFCALQFFHFMDLNLFHFYYSVWGQCYLTHSSTTLPTPKQFPDTSSHGYLLCPATSVSPADWPQWTRSRIAGQEVRALQHPSETLGQLWAVSWGISENSSTLLLKEQCSHTWKIAWPTTTVLEMWEVILPEHAPSGPVSYKLAYFWAQNFS